MSRRKAVWGARLALICLALLPCWGLSLISISHSHSFWPYGHVHNLLEGIAAVASYPILGIGGLVLAVLTIPWGLYALIRTAKDKPCQSWSYFYDIHVGTTQTKVSRSWSDLD